MLAGVVYVGCLCVRGSLAVPSGALWVLVRLTPGICSGSVGLGGVAGLGFMRLTPGMICSGS